MRSARAWCWWLSSALLIVLTVSGCPKKPQPPGEAGSLDSGELAAVTAYIFRANDVSAALSATSTLCSSP